MRCRMSFKKMIKIFKNFLIFLLAISLVFPFELNRTEAASNNLNKTVEFFIGQDNAVRASGELVSLSSFTINVSEGSPVVKSAVIEINGVSYNDSGVNQTIMADLQRNADLNGTEPAYVFTYILGGTNGKPRPFTIKYNALENNLGIAGQGAMSDIIVSNTNYIYKLYLKDTVASGTVNFSLASAKLILTYYNNSSAGSNLLKTNKFFVVQETAGKTDGEEASKDFTITIPEQSPAIQSVFIEVSGSAKSSGVGAGTVGVSVTDQGALANYTNYSLDLGGAGNISRFIVRHDASAVILGDSSVKTYTLRLRGTGFSTNLWNAKAIVTYKYSVNTGNLPAKGELISSTFDTWDGVEPHKGVAYNSLIWKGDLKGGQVGQVGLQLAASNCPNGKTNPPDCNDAGVWSFEGPECNSGTSYTPAANTPIPIEIACAASHNNKRYFRYKVIICSSANCIDSGSINPEVDEVVVNWGP